MEGPVDDPRCAVFVDAWFCRFKRVQVFVTSVEYTGNLGGLAGADTSCMAAARDSALAGASWAAWLSDDVRDAIDRIPFPDAEYQLLDGTVVANDLADLTDGTLDAPIDLDEKLATVGSEVVQVFVTSDTFNGNLGGLDGADTKCTAAATAAGLGGNWTAWLSDNATNARDRIPDGEYRLLNETVVANNLDDLTDATVDAAINLDEEQSTVTTNTDVWIATATDGTNQGFSSCLNWSTPDSAERGRIGRSTSDDAFWTDVGGGNTCDATRRLYCSSAPSAP
jgi:hypothetical protein